MPTALYMHYCALVYNVVLGRLRFSQIYFDIFWIDWGHLIVIYIIYIQGTTKIRCQDSDGRPRVPLFQDRLIFSHQDIPCIYMMYDRGNVFFSFRRIYIEPRYNHERKELNCILVAMHHLGCRVCRAGVNRYPVSGISPLSMHQN